MNKAKNNKHNISPRHIWEEIKSLILIVLFALSIRVLIFEPFYIPSPSMKTTLVEGDYVFSTKYSYGYSRHSFIISTNLFSGRVLESLPERGDIVIFRPPHDMNTRYIKRLIGLPGEKIELKGGVVYVNDIPLKRELVSTYEESGTIFEEYKEILPSNYAYQTRYIKQLPLEGMNIRDLRRANNIGPFFIPDGHYFFLGDNRDQSGDSRFQMGVVPFENFISKAQFVFFSFEEKLLLDNSFSLEQITQIWKWIRSFKSERFFAPIRLSGIPN
ncbi:MAG: signal peptidase I [Rickettsiaceae bacterium]|nr:signal peptidase I [Rickettsiaceae bacterium]